MEIGSALRAANAQCVTGWRVWTVAGTSEGVRLASVIYDTVWLPGGESTATCRHEHAHAAPELDCSCGFYAAHDPVDALSYLQGRDEPRTLCRVLGEVTLTRAVVETETGYRAAAAYPLRLYCGNEVVAANLEQVYGVPVLSPGCAFVSATSSTPASAGSSTSSWSAARTWSSRMAASG